MNDRKQISTGDRALDGDLDAASRAYRQTEDMLPPPAMDDAIRAAARRAVKSGPRATGKSWLLRWSAPLSAAAAVVLTVSVGYRVLLEQPDLTPTVSREIGKPAVASLPKAELHAKSIENVAPAAAVSPPVPGLVAAEKAVLAEPVSSPAKRMEASSTADRRQRSPMPLAVPAPPAAIAPVAPPAPAFAPDPIAGAAPIKERTVVFAQSAARESIERKEISNQVAASSAPARSEEAAPAAKVDVQPLAAPMVAPLPVLAARPAPAPPPPAIPAQALKAADASSEAPAAWMKRILDLKRDGKMREFEEELAKFRKRHPGYVLPEELSAYR